MYICIEGIDGAGKSLQVKLLSEKLKKCGYKVIQIKEPTDSEIGKLIRKLLRKEVNNALMTLLFAADRIILSEKIKKLLKKGYLVISDRCLWSSFVYQSIDIGEDWVEEVNKYALKPDITILLDVDVDVAMKRCEKKEIFENSSYLNKARRKYLQLAKKHNFIIIDANNDIKTVHNEILKVIAAKIQKKNNYECNSRT